MIPASRILEMLIPTGGWLTSGTEYKGIIFLECEPITKTQFEQGRKDYPAWKSAQDAVAADRKAAILARLGITEEELRIATSN